MQCELAKQVKTLLSFSPGMLCFQYELDDLIDMIERSAVVFLSLDELKSLVKEEDYEKGADILLNRGAQIVCVTLGARGCFVADSLGAAHEIAAYPTDVVDTTGAGDSFAAGFLYGLLQKKSIEDSGKIGNKVASFCIREYGARKGLPFNLSL